MNTRKILSIVLSLMMILTALPLTAVNSFADTVGYEYLTFGDFKYWVISDKNKTCGIGEYLGSATELEIPSIIAGYSVTSIGSSAFYGCTSLASITLPDSVTSIGEDAFYNTAYYNNAGNWEDGVLYIGHHLIKANDDTIPNNYTIKYGTLTITDSAFDGCTSLASVTIPNSVTSIGYDAFYKCTSLTSVTIPDSVTSIGAYAFYECTSLEIIIIPDSVTSIGNCAFYNTAYYNNSDNWENGVLYMGHHLIDTDTEYDWETGTYVTTVPSEYSIKEGTLTIAEYAFSRCTSLESIIIPNSVTSIVCRAFQICTSLESITIPDSVTSIEDWVFYGCTSLESITIPDKVTSIGCNAFRDTAYYNNVNNWEDGVLYIGHHLIVANEDTVPNNYTIEDGTLTIADWAFYWCTSLESIIIPNSVTSIGNRAFHDCTSLTSVTIPDSVTYIGNRAFGYCWNNETEGYEKIEGFTLTGYESTEAEHYANDNGFTFIALEKAPIIDPADLNGDGKITVVDAKWTLQAVANSRTLTAEQITAADVNGDGKVTVVDAKWILQAVAGMRDLDK